MTLWIFCRNPASRTFFGFYIKTQSWWKLLFIILDLSYFLKKYLENIGLNQNLSGGQFRPTVLCYIQVIFDLNKQGDSGNSLVLLVVTPLWHVTQWVSRASPHHTHSAFLSLNRLLRFYCRIFIHWIEEKYDFMVKFRQNGSQAWSRMSINTDDFWAIIWDHTFVTFFASKLTNFSFPDRPDDMILISIKRLKDLFNF